MKSTEGGLRGAPTEESESGGESWMPQLMRHDRIGRKRAADGTAPRKRQIVYSAKNWWIDEI